MSIPIAGNGFQVGDGRSGELVFGTMAAPQTATSTATLTTAQILGGVLVGNPSTSAATYTLPTVADTEAALASLGGLKTNQCFDLVIINLGTSSGVITVAAGTGWTLVGMATLPITTAAGSSARFRARKTGSGAWSLYRIA